MGRLRRLRTRFVSSIGAVKRSLRRQSQTNSTASNPTTLTRLASLDSAVPSSGARARARGSRAGKRKLQVRLDAGEQEQDGSKEQLHLHWNEARRIYSEPVQAIQALSRGEERLSSTGTTVTDCRSLSEQNAGISICCPAEPQTSDEDDDVFLQSWEEQRAGEKWL